MSDAKEKSQLDELIDEVKNEEPQDEPEVLLSVAEIDEKIAALPQNISVADVDKLIAPLMPSMAAANEAAQEYWLEQIAARVPGFKPKFFRAMLRKAIADRERRQSKAERDHHSGGPAACDPDQNVNRYSPDELAAIAADQHCTVEELQHRWVVQRAKSYYVLSDGKYRAPIIKDELALSLPRDLARAPVEWVIYTKNGPIPKSIAQMVLDYGTVARHVVADLTLEHGYYDASSETFYEAVCPLRKLTPTFHPNIDQWLRLLGGADINKLLDWIATITRLDRQTCALYLSGLGGPGKGMVAQGLARLWSAGGPTELARVLDNFNADLARCPLIFCDEALPQRFRGQRTSAELRALIGTNTRTLSRKFLPNADLRGSIRLVLAANNDRMLALDEDLSAHDLDAVAQRFLHIEVPAAAAEYLKSIGGRAGTDGWVDKDMIAEHALWLRDNRVVKPGNRFLVEGHVTRMHHNLAARGKTAALALEWIAKYLRETKPSLAESGRIKVGDGKILVNTTLLSENWTHYIKSDFVPTTTKLGRALSNLSVGTVDQEDEERTMPLSRRKQNIRFHSIDPELVYAWAAENQVGDSKAMKERVNMKLDAPAPASHGEEKPTPTDPPLHDGFH